MATAEARATTAEEFVAFFTELWAIGATDVERPWASARLLPGLLRRKERT